MLRILLFVSMYWCCISVFAQSKIDPILGRILEESESDLVRRIANQKDTFRLQIIYTQIDRDEHNVAAFTHHHFNVDPALYYNPASTVKLPLALLALEKLNQMKQKGVNKHTPMQFDSTFEMQIKAYTDETAENNYPSIGHYIKKAFLVSDNDAYNRLYQFVGQKTVKQVLEKKGYRNTRINRQFMGFSEEQNRHSNRIRFVDKSGNTFFTQDAAYNDDPFRYGNVVKIGKGHLDRNDSLIHEPIDFTKANNVSLADLQQMLQSVIFPESVPQRQRWNLSDDDYEFVYRFLSQYPSETSYPKYDTAEYYDSYVKFFFRNSSHKMPDDLRVFNKVGWAYGFLTDVSYVADFGNQVEFMLTATLYVNSDGVLNDNKYEYETVGWPFLYDLGQTIYEHELKRPRANRPDLRKFRIRYEERDPRDTRPSLRNVDN